VVGELEAMRYPPTYLNLFTDAQKQKVAELFPPEVIEDA
jgi:hypothetical protein